MRGCQLGVLLGFNDGVTASSLRRAVAEAGRRAAWRAAPRPKGHVTPTNPEHRPCLIWQSERREIPRLGRPNAAPYMAPGAPDRRQRPRAGPPGMRKPAVPSRGTNLADPGGRRDRLSASAVDGPQPFASQIDCPTPKVKNLLKKVHTRAAEGSRVEWEVLLTAEVEAFLDELYESDPASHQLVNQAILVLKRNGPAEGRPLVDTITASRIANMKEVRPPSAGRSEIRILLVFDPWRSVVLLVGGDKSGQWDKWYRTAIPRAEQLYDDYLAERSKEMDP